MLSAFNLYLFCFLVYPIPKGFSIDGKILSLFIYLYILNKALKNNICSYLPFVLV
ncbi:hypothetical protein HMPREF6123_1317 [Oribacterium sinus F0268]|uniref:Uncharacterized protein n=1 Tax=Oribacterium sinus F0268 TaxID=585501 RepID=C2KXU8_9FIRM|nr:hypothetical protein HMPREF6123_1317 [Oribacterium sinus F0268]